MKTTAILIDDERKALETLKSKLQRFCPEVIIIAETQRPEEAISLIETKNPDLLFLDVAMPQMSGFDVLERLDTPRFETIFVTAFDHYAIQAINQSAIGYLVKPVDNEDLQRTVQKAMTNIQNKNALQKNRVLLENLRSAGFQQKKIVIPVQEGLEFVKISSIIRCEGVDGYTKIIVEPKKEILSSYSIGYFNELLKNESFFATHKSHLVNLDYIRKYLNEGYVVLTTNEHIPVSRGRRADFLDNIRGH